MQKRRIEKTKEKKRESSWGRKIKKKTVPYIKNRKAFERCFKKAQKEGLSSRDLLKCLHSVPHFLGVFAADELKFILIKKFPIFLIVNLDSSNFPGSHWISIRIGTKFVEVFDSLGFRSELWDRYSPIIFHFLKNFAKTHNFLISPIMQMPYTFDCGLFCLYFVVYRQFLSFSALISPFTSDLKFNREFLSANILKLC